MTAYRSANDYRGTALQYDGGGGVPATVTPAAISASATLGVSASGSASVAPGGVSSSAAVGSVASGAAEVSPTGVSGSVAVGSSVSGTATAVPVALAVFSAGSAVASGAAVVSPGVVGGAAAVPSVSVSVDVTVVTSVVAGVASVPSPTVIVHGLAEPAAVAGSVSLGVSASGSAVAPVSAVSGVSSLGSDARLSVTYFRFVNPVGPGSKPNRTSAKWGELNVSVHPGSESQLTVVRRGGVYSSHLVPSADDLASADEVFQGGRVNVVTADDRDAIVASGIGGEFELIG